MPRSGKFCNGDRFVLSPCTYTGDSLVPMVIEDAPNIEGGAQTDVLKHGVGLNLGLATPSGQPFTDRSTTGLSPNSYRANLNIGTELPYVFAAGEEGSLTKSKFDENGNAAGRPLITRRHIVTVVAQEPPANAFRPGVAAASKVSHWTEDDMLDLSTLPSLSIPFNALNVRELLRYDQCIEHGNGTKFDKVNPNFNVPGRFGARGPGKNSAAGVLMLCSDISLAQKRDIAVAICQFAIDLYERAKRINALGDLDWGGLNGSLGLGAINQRGYKIVLIVGGILLDDADMIAMGQNQIFAEDGSSKYVTQDMIDNGVNPPGNVSGGFAQYEDDDIDAPEWFQANILQTNSGNRLPSDTYRGQNLSMRVRQALAIHLFPGLYANYLPTTTRDPYLDYADRVMERNFFKDPADPQNIFQLARNTSGPGRTTDADIQIWDDYRVSHGQTPIWDWPA